MGNGGLSRDAGLASSSQVAEGRGTEVASKETRLLWKLNLGLEALVLGRSAVEDEVLWEEREDARGRESMTTVAVLGKCGGLGYEDVRN